ncbi:MAG: N-acetylmuramoyl-L-alanine amidase, partial [Proteobacteria bacterium]|nr:N-acetylmuramoyl-L-alanine amidase [Pseudomonadota bacterium]
MIKLKNSNFSIIFTIFFLITLFIASDKAFATTAKERYLLADSSYKKLRNSASKQKKASEWLNCISKYEIIYRVHPESSWAPAGMYKASSLYLTLSKLSGNTTYEDQALDLLQRIQNRYPKSSYAGRAATLMKSLNISQQQPSKTEKTLTSLKYRTKDDGKIKAFKEQIDAKEEKKQDREEKRQEKLQSAYEQKIVIPDTLPEYSAAKPTEDTTITDLRFWSNPEYTRIVVNADAERDYSHRLLKKDPDINKPFQRLYVDIEQSKLGGKVAEHTPINDNLLKQARAGQYLPHTVRVVVDIKSFENYKIFSLKDPFRIVIDVWGKDSNGSQASGSIADAEPPREAHSIITTDNLQSSDIARQLALGVRKIVIDPGHGGADPGAPGYFKGVWEKDIVLKIAKKLAVILRDKLKCTVVLTRSKDEKLTLEERTAIANTEKADLFISLHCNAAKNRNLAGIETYILNLATDDQAIAVAARENATSRKNISDLEYILSDLMKHAKIEESTRLANVVQASFVSSMKAKYTGIHDLGVKKAPFY